VSKVELHNLTLFILAGLLLNITPGPDLMYIVTRSISEGKWAGIVSALGVTAGCIFHILAVSFGLSGLLLAIPAAYDIIKYLGAAYLVYLGLKLIIKGNDYVFEKKGSGRVPLKNVFYQGMLTNVLNPKVALFFLAFLPQFIYPGGDVTLQLLVLGLVFNINGTVVNLLVALTASRLGEFLKSKLKNSNVFKWISASVFIGLGLRLALLERK
jgi:threonine/homoserine/homoserine lactone efflux protein